MGHTPLGSSIHLRLGHNKIKELKLLLGPAPRPISRSIVVGWGLFITQ